jgi:hypothetical protein
MTPWLQYCPSRHGRRCGYYSAGSRPTGETSLQVGLGQRVYRSGIMDRGVPPVQLSWPDRRATRCWLRGNGRPARGHAALQLRAYKGGARADPNQMMRNVATRLSGEIDGGLIPPGPALNLGRPAESEATI